MNPYLPTLAQIIKIKDETPDTKTFKINMPISFKPGQFVELSVFGYGEAPISISGGDTKSMDLTIRAVGNLTKKIYRMNVGEYVGIRGPFGNGWPLEKALGKNILIVAGGVGLAPLKSLIDYLCLNREKYKEITLLYGAKKPSLILFKYKFKEWDEYINSLLTVDEPDEKWDGYVGVVTNLFKHINNMDDAFTFMCGPPIMMKYASIILLNYGFSPDKIYLSLERNMRCGIGICGHCTIGSVYVCRDGPVFSLSELMNLVEKPQELEGVYIK